MSKLPDFGDRSLHLAPLACGKTPICKPKVLSEECRRPRKSEPPLFSGSNLTPFSKGERAIEFEDLAAAKVTFLVKMVVD